MRICISSRSLNTFGGAERVILSDAHYFSNADHEVHIIADEFDPAVLSSYGHSQSVTVHEIDISQPGPFPKTFSRAYETRRVLERIEPDAVIAHYHEKATWLALTMLDITPTFVTHVHGSLFWFENNVNRTAHMWKGCAQELVSEVPGHSEFWTLEELSPLQLVHAFGAELLETLTLRSCDEVFVNSSQVARELRCLYGVDASVNPPGIDEDRFSSSANRDLPIDTPFVFSLSRLDPRKRIDLLIRSFARFRDLYPEFQLVIGGTGKQEDALKDLATELGVRDAVVFEGHIDEESLPSYYSGAEIFACPGWMSYGLTPFEAVHSGTKVALSSDAFVKELIEDEPGIRVLSPDVDSWVSGLAELVDCDECPSGAGLPTVKEHTDTKLTVLER